MEGGVGRGGEIALTPGTLLLIHHWYLKGFNLTLLSLNPRTGLTKVWCVVLILNKCYNSCMYINLELCWVFTFWHFPWKMPLGVFDGQTCLVDTIYIKCHVTIRREFGLSYIWFDSNGEAVYMFQCMHGFMKFQVWLNWLH